MTDTRSPNRMDPKRAPQFMDHCDTCTHTQNYHLTTQGPYIEGFRKNCWFDNGCGCKTFVSTWGSKKGLAS